MISVSDVRSADLSAESKLGFTPVQVAEFESLPSIVNFLKKAGAEN